jgi:hypothetical protein
MQFRRPRRAAAGLPPAAVAPERSSGSVAGETCPVTGVGIGRRRELSDSLASVAQFLKIDDDLIAVAAKASVPLVSVSDDGIADWVTALPASEMTSRHSPRGYANCGRGTRNGHR